MKYLIKSHPIVLYCLVILPRLKMDISHVDFQFSSVVEHSVLGYHLNIEWFYYFLNAKLKSLLPSMC